MVHEATGAVDIVSEFETRYQAFSVNESFNFRALDMLVSLYRQFRQFDKVIALLNGTMNGEDLQPIQRVFTQAILPMVLEDIVRLWCCQCRIPKASRSLPTGWIC